ncbi:MAG: phage scaffolding protein [Lawsonibacter sp.]
MLDWLKTILGDQYTEDIDKKVSTEIGKVFVSKTDFNTVNEEKKTLTGQIKERDAQLEELKKVDAPGLQAKIAELQSANTAAQQKYDADLKAAKLDFALESRLSREGAVNTRAVRALLDASKISLDGENLVGLDDQLKTLKEKETWAFKPADTNVPGNGGNPPPASGGEKTPLPSGTVIF